MPAAKVSGKWFLDIVMPTIREQETAANKFLRFESKPIKIVADAYSKKYFFAEDACNITGLKNINQTTCG